MQEIPSEYATASCADRLTQNWKEDVERSSSAIDARSEFWVITTTRKFAFSHFPKRVTITTTFAYVSRYE